MTSASDEKCRPSNVCVFFFSVQGTGGSPTEPDPENRVGDQDIGVPDRPVSSGLQVPGEPGHCRARTRPPWRAYRAIFPSKCPSIAPAEMSNTPRWKIISEDSVLIPKNRGMRELFQGIFALGIFGGGVSRYAATPLNVAVSGSQLYNQVSPVVTNCHRKSFGSRLTKKFRKLLRRMAPSTFYSRVQAFRDPLRGELPRVQIFMNDGPNPLT